MNDPIETYCKTFAWTLDFWRAFMERPKILRWIARLAMGKYAYRELYGAKEAIQDGGWDMLDYSLQEMDYHNENVPT